MFGDTGNDLLGGGDGMDILSGGEGIDTLNGNSGDDILLFEAERVFTQISGQDVYAHNKDGDFTAGTGIKLNEAGSRFFGSLDTFQGGAGHDTLLGTGGHDVVFRYSLDANGARTSALISGVEEFVMGGGDDIVDLTGPLEANATQSSRITVFGESGRDALWTSEADDVLVGGDDGDWLSAGKGNDVLYGGNETGPDTNSAGSGWTVNGFGGRVFSDLLDGGEGNDTLYGGSGDDLLAGGSGVDSLTGGAGGDYFLFRVAGASGWGGDTVQDFDFLSGDRLAADGWDDALVSSSFLGGGDLQLSFSGNSITLVGFDSADLTAAGGVGNLFA
jgi:Ca2+-binding RTX toxin-like protein